MLKHLIKYELKATGRQFVPLYGMLLALSVVLKIFFAFSSVEFFGYTNNFGGGTDSFADLPLMIGMMVYLAIIVAIFVLTFVVMLQRFNKSLLSDEGYLMFTLPVRTWQLITSKLLVTILWIIASAAVTMLTIFILAFNTEMLRMIPEVFANFKEFWQLWFGSSEVLIFVEIVINGITSMVCGILQIYAAIAIGHLFHRNRMLAAFGAFIGINIVMSTISGTVMRVISISTGSDNQFGAGVFHLVTISGILLTLLFAAAFFFTTNYILSKRLNLE